MRVWVFIAAGAFILGYFVLVNIGSSMALADIGARPILALRRDDAEPVPVQTPGQPAAPGEARPLGGEGIMFGMRLTYVLPDGSRVVCSIRFRKLTCSEGWTALR